MLNCAAFTAVDAAESREAEALAVNGTAVGHLAEAADAAGAVLVQVSTDYVFDGEADRPYREDDAVNPLSAYGRTKLAGELAAARAAPAPDRPHRLAVRRGEQLRRGDPAVRSAAGRQELRVVDDQDGCPTYAEDLAAALLALLERGATGRLPRRQRGATTWCGFAREIVRLRGARVRVVPVSTRGGAAAGTAARAARCSTRRGWSGLLGAALPPWQEALARYLRGR